MRLRPRSLALAVVLALGGSGVAAVAPATAAPELKAAPVVSRVAGGDRFETANLTATSFQGQQAKAVVLTRQDVFADALAGAPLASDKGGPLLLTARDALLPSVASTITGVLAPGGTVYLLGDEKSLSAGVEQSVRALGYTPRRLAGTTRFETAVAVARELPQASTVALVNGWNFPDGLAAGALMGVVDDATKHSLGVVLLSDGAGVDRTTADYLASRQWRTKVAVGGVAGTAAAGLGAGWGAIAGSDRYETAAQVARYFESDGFFQDATTTAGVATGEKWPDALAGSALLAWAAGPVVLTRPDGLPTASRDALRGLQADARAGGKQITQVLVFGDQSSVSDKAFGEVSAAVS